MAQDRQSLRPGDGADSETLVVLARRAAVHMCLMICLSAFMPVCVCRSQCFYFGLYMVLSPQVE